MIDTPINTPALSSVAVRPGNERAETRPTNSAAAAKRRPTKNIGPLTVITLCTSKKVPPQSTVINTSTSSALLSRKETEGRSAAFVGVMALHTEEGRRTIAVKVGSILRNPY
ncbi:hypothetical protein D3C80_1761340 [compost metagenome]